MTTDIWRDFDPNVGIPIGLKNAREIIRPDADEYGDPDPDIDVQDDTLIDDDSELDEDENSDELDVPEGFTVISQTIHTLPDGTQLVDVVIEVDEVEDADTYELRISQ